MRSVFVSSGGGRSRTSHQLIGPQFKRIAALQGDFVFHGPRRLFLKFRASKQRAWGFSTSLAPLDAIAVTDTLVKSTSVSRIRLSLERWELVLTFLH